MKIAVCGSLMAQAHLRDMRDRLYAQGHWVTSRWLDRELPDVKNTDGKAICDIAWQDYIDVTECDLFIVSNFEPSTSGGMHTELGVALALGIPVWVVGSPTNIYHYMADVIVTDWEQALRLTAGLIECEAS